MQILFRLSLWLAAMVPPRAAIAFSRTIGRAISWTNTEVAHVIRVNLQLCFPEHSVESIKLLVRDRLTHMTLLFFEFAYLMHWDIVRLLESVVAVQGEEHLREAFNSERGVLLLVPHYGNWELLCAYLGHHFSVAALYDPPKVASLEPVILAARQKYQGEMYRIDTAGMRGLLKVMRGGGLVAILPDQVPDRAAGVYADFFAQPALTMTLTHRLMKATNPAVLMGSVQRAPLQGGLSYALNFTPLNLATTDAQQCVEGINAAIEEVARTAPEQYQWEYKRFKRPAESKRTNVYRDARD